MSIQKKQKILRCITTTLSVLIIGFIFIQSMKPAAQSGAESGRVVAFFNSIAASVGLGEPFTQGFIRTCAHFAEFGILGLSLFAMFTTYLIKMKNSFILSTASFVSVALIDECIQIFSDGRTFQIKDICVDAAGALCGCLFMFLLMLIVKHYKRKKLY